MVARSVPLYRDVIDVTAHWAIRYYREGTAVYDIGCSTGTQLDLIGRLSPHPVRLVGVDGSKSMLDRARAKLAEVAARHEVQLVHEDAVGSDYENASVAILNYTLQFVPVVQRPILLEKLANALCPGGILILSEKVRSSRPDFQETITRLHEDFKARNGYTRTEIARKKEALENVLVSLTLEQQLEQLERAGFAHAETILRWHNFVTVVAAR
ncbi:MAG: methyltransferase domain-containing protein [Planctomycetes bacterium]|nr:methyltransferase domain-containing protein [Planctomycetota bacterium]